MTLYICLVYLVENDMSAMSKKEADTCVEETVACDDGLRRPATSSPARRAASPDQGAAGRLPADRGRDLNEAIRVAAKIPMASLGRIEVRPIKELRP